MTQKTIKTRLINKHSLESDWVKAKNFIPMRGELIIYDPEVDADGNILTLPEGRTEPYTYSRFKIGDGVHLVSALPFTLDLILTDARAYVDEAILNGVW